MNLFAPLSVIVIGICDIAYRKGRLNFARCHRWRDMLYKVERSDGVVFSENYNSFYYSDSNIIYNL